MLHGLSANSCCAAERPRRGALEQNSCPAQALLAMLLESQSSPSYSPSPLVAQVLWMYQWRCRRLCRPSLSVISAAFMAFGKSCRQGRAQPLKRVMPVLPEWQGHMGRGQQLQAQLSKDSGDTDTPRGSHHLGLHVMEACKAAVCPVYVQCGAGVKPLHQASECCMLDFQGFLSKGQLGCRDRQLHHMRRGDARMLCHACWKQTLQPATRAQRRPTSHCMSAGMCKTTGTRQVNDFSISAAQSCAALHALPRSVVGPYARLNSPPGAHGKQATMCCQTCASCCAAATLLPEQQSQLCSKTTREAINQHMCQQHVGLRQPMQRSAHCAVVQHAWHCPGGPRKPAQQLRMACV